MYLVEGLVLIELNNKMIVDVDFNQREKDEFEISEMFSKHKDLDNCLLSKTIYFNEDSKSQNREMKLNYLKESGAKDLCNGSYLVSPKELNNQNENDDEDEEESEHEDKQSLEYIMQIKAQNKANEFYCGYLDYQDELKNVYSDSKTKSGIKKLINRAIQESDSIKLNHHISCPACFNILASVVDNSNGKPETFNATDVIIDNKLSTLVCKHCLNVVGNYDNFTGLYSFTSYI